MCILFTATGNRGSKPITNSQMIRYSLGTLSETPSGVHSFVFYMSTYQKTMNYLCTVMHDGGNKWKTATNESKNKIYYLMSDITIFWFISGVTLQRNRKIYKHEFATTKFPTIFTKSVFLLQKPDLETNRRYIHRFVLVTRYSKRFHDVLLKGCISKRSSQAKTLVALWKRYIHIMFTRSENCLVFMNSLHIRI